MRKLVEQGCTAALAARTLARSWSSSYYRKKPRGTRAGRTYGERTVVAQ
jgi:hypothetical protein